MGAARLGVCSQGQPPNPGRALRLPKFRRVGGCRCGARAPRRVSLVSPAHPRSRLLPAPPFPPSPVHPGPGLTSAPPGPLPHQSFSVPCPVGTHRAPVAPGGGRVRICSGRGWRLRVCVRRGGGRSPAAAGLSGWRSTRAGRSPCGGCLCVFGSCAGDRRGRPLAGLARSPGAAHPPACVEGERGRERREVVSPVALRGRVWRPASVRPSLPRWAPSRRTRPLGAVGARGPRGSSSSPLLLHPGGTRSGAGPRDAAASVRRCESPPGVASSGRERASLTRCVPASLGGTRRLWAVRPGGCV